MSIVFGSEESRELLRREGGFDFDLHALEPFGYRQMTAARHARLAEELGQAEEEVDGWCRVCDAFARWVECRTCGGFGEIRFDEDDERDCDACAGMGGNWRCADVDYNAGANKVQP